jgi:hypothetical protein
MAMRLFLPPFLKGDTGGFVTAPHARALVLDIFSRTGKMPVPEQYSNFDRTGKMPVLLNRPETQVRRYTNRITPH